MSVNTSNNTTTASSAQPKTVEELKAEVQECYAQLRNAASQNGRLFLEEAVRNLRAGYQEQITHPEKFKTPLPVADQLEAMRMILEEPEVYDSNLDAQKNQEEDKAKKESVRKELRALSKWVEASERQCAHTEKKLKENFDQERYDLHLQNANRAREVRLSLANRPESHARALAQNAVNEQLGRDKFKSLQDLIKAPKANVGAEGQAKTTADKSNPNFKNEKPQTDKSKFAKAQTATDETKSEELESAFAGDFENGETKKTETTKRASENQVRQTEDDANVDLAQQTQDGASTPDEAMGLVKNGLAAGVLQKNATAACLNPKRDLTKAMRSIADKCKGLLSEIAEESDALGSAMIFCLQGAVRQARVGAFRALHDGQIGNGHPDLIEKELERVQAQSQRVVSGSATQSTVPTQVLENGRVSAAKSREQLQSLVNEPVSAFATYDQDPVLRSRQSWQHWQPRKDTVAANRLEHEKEILS